MADGQKQYSYDVKGKDGGTYTINSPKDLSDQELVELVNKHTGGQPQNTSVPVPVASPSGSPSMMNIPESTQQNVAAIGNTFNEASDKLRKGSIVAGGAQAGRGALEAVLSPLQLADAKIREALPAGLPQEGFNPFSKATVGNVVNLGLDALGLIPKATGALYKAGTQAALGYAGALDQNLFTTPENAKQIREEVPKLGETIGSIAGAPEIGGALNAANKIGAKMDNAGWIQKGNKLFLDAFPALKKETTVKPQIEKGAEHFAQSFRDKPLDRTKGATSESRQFYDRSREIKQNIFEERMNPAVEYYKDIPIDITSTIKKPLLDYFSKDTKKWANPKKVEAIKEYVNNTLPKDMTVGQMRDFIVDLNAETKGYKSASPAEQAAMFSADPTVALKVDLVDGLRETMLKKMDELGSPEVKAFRKEYGAVSKMGEMAYRNIVQAERQKPSFLGSPSPAKAGLMLSGELMLMLHNPPAAMAGVGASLVRDWFMNRNLKDPTIARAIKAWTKSDLKPSEYSFTPPQFKLLAAPNTRIAPAYQSQSQGYPTSAPQMADILKVDQGKFPPPEAPLEAGLPNSPQPTPPQPSVEQALASQRKSNVEQSPISQILPQTPVTVESMADKLATRPIDYSFPPEEIAFILRNEQAISDAINRLHPDAFEKAHEVAQTPPITENPTVNPSEQQVVQPTTEATPPEVPLARPKRSKKK